MKDDPEQDLLDVARIFQTFEEQGDSDIDPDSLSDVPVPAPHKPTSPGLSVALPEPDEEEPS